MLLQRLRAHINRLILLLCLILSNQAKSNDVIISEFNDYTYSIVQIEINNVLLDDFIDSYNIKYKLIASSDDCYSRVALKFII